MSYGNYAPFYRGGYFNPMQPPTMPQMVENQGQYVPQYQAPIQTNPVPMPQPTSDTIWVLNENEATSYPVGLNTTVVLWDKSNPTIYVKSVNANGIPSMRVLDFTERNVDNSKSAQNEPVAHKCTCGDQFITKEEFNALKGKFYDLQARYDKLVLEQEEKPKTTSKKSKESEE